MSAKSTMLLLSVATLAAACRPVGCPTPSLGSSSDSGLSCGGPVFDTGSDDDTGVGPEPAEETDPKPIIASSCSELAGQDPTATDGPATLSIGSRQVEVHCHDMDGEPVAYLPLQKGNFSEYAAGGASPGETVRTIWQMVRIDLEQLSIDMNDTAFASSTGELLHSGDELVDHMPFGVAMTCTAAADAAARVDLRGTPFAVASGWQPGGHRAEGTAVVEQDDQLINLTGGGDCGWMYPGAAYEPINDNVAGRLPLRWLDQEPAPIEASSCADLRSQTPVTEDGFYELNLTGGTAEIYCADMQTQPKEYLFLMAENYSQYSAGGASPGTSVRTDFDMVRLDVDTLTVDLSDDRFSSSSGELRHRGNEVVTSMPFGVAMSCTGAPDGRAVVDLSGTPFRVADAFVPGGHRGEGSATASVDNQRLDIEGGGYCGWMYPGPAHHPFNLTASAFDLQLSW